jgi:hypothetical protein
MIIAIVILIAAAIAAVLYVLAWIFPTEAPSSRSTSSRRSRSLVSQRLRKARTRGLRPASGQGSGHDYGLSSLAHDEEAPMRRLSLALLLTVSLALVIAGGAAGADEPEPSESPVNPALCDDGPEGAPAPAYCGDDAPPVAAELAAQATATSSCTKRVEIVFWTANRWRPLMRALAANPAACADYYISIPPADGNRTLLRAGSVYREVRDLGPRFHSVAEMTLGLSGWAQWVAAGNGTWYDAGVEFRRRMAAINLQPELGHTWLVNEFDHTTRLDLAVRPIGVTPGYPRTAMRDLIRGLYEGAPGMAPAPGIVEIGIAQSHQNLPDVPAYKEQMKGWLLDGGFWAAMDGKIGWLAHEVYADTRFHGVPGSRLEERRRHLVDYQEHLLELVKAGGRRVLPARAFFKETFMPFTNGGGYVALGGDAQGFEGGHGNTEIPLDQMMKFVSEQVNAVEYYAERHFDAAATRRIGFSWQPVNRFGLPGTQFEAEVEQQAAHIATVLAATYGPVGSSKAACLRETGLDWCTMQRPDAVFTDAWEFFSAWD